MTDIDKTIARLEKLERLATPGPWGTHLITSNGRTGDYSEWPKFEKPPVVGSEVATLFNISNDMGIIAHITSPAHGKKGAADTALIAVMRNELPELLQELKRLKRKCEED